MNKHNIFVTNINRTWKL